MRKKRLFAYHLIIFFCFSLSVFAAKKEELWLFQQEFVKFGKRDFYEEWKKQWLQKWKIQEGKKLPILAIEDKDSSQYIYLIAVENFNGLERFFAKQKNFQETMDIFLKKSYAASASATLNFCILSLHQYLPTCSYIPKGQNCSIQLLPAVKYRIYSVMPGNAEAFENNLEKKALSYQKKQATFCWRSWKVIFGGEIPKYIIAFFATDEESLSDIPDLLGENMREIVTRTKEGKGEFRKDLSIFQ